MPRVAPRGRRHLSRRPRPKAESSPLRKNRSIFSEPAIQIGLLRAGSLMIDTFCPGVAKIVDNAIAQAMKPKIAEAVSELDVTDMELGEDGVYRPRVH